MPKVEAHITGTVWKIEVAVGDEVDGGRHRRDPRVDEDGDARRGGGRRDRGARSSARRARRSTKATRSLSSPTDARRELADGKLLLDRPAEHVARLTIANPDKRNALDHAILDAIAEAVPALDARCLLVTGAGRTFSAGYDIGDMPDETFAEEAEKLVAHPFAAAIEALDAYPYPTVAALNGHAIGGGLELALSCDLRVAAAGALVGMPPAKLGLVYSHTGLQKFIDAIGVAAHARAVPRRPQHPRRGGARLGPGQRGAPARRAAGRRARPGAEIAGQRAARAERQQDRDPAAARGPHGALDPDVERELVELRRACFASEDFREGVRAFAEKRTPRWRAR